MVLAITKSLGSLTFAWLALANDANVSGVSEERPFYFNWIYGSYSFIEMPLELMRLKRVPFVITLHKSQANMLQNVTEKGYERSIKEDIITKNVPGKQICIPCCLSGLGTGYKNHHFSLEQNWAEAPRPQCSTYYVTQQLYWIVMNIAKFSAHTPLTGRKSFLISLFNFKTCKTKWNVFIM